MEEPTSDWHDGPGVQTKSVVLIFNLALSNHVGPYLPSGPSVRK